MTGTNDTRNHIPYQEATENIKEAIKSIKENHPTTNILLVQPPHHNQRHQHNIHRKTRWQPEGSFNIEMSSYQYRNSHCGEKTILWPSYLHNGNSYTGKMTSLYWIRALEIIAKEEEINYVYTEQTINEGSTAMEQDGCHLNQTGRQIYVAAILQAKDEPLQETQIKQHRSDKSKTAKKQ